MAWFRPMGAAEVAYHQETVVGRADDHPGAALDYYGSRGETPLRWGGAGGARLGLEGEITAEAYEAAFGEGGFTLPGSGTARKASMPPSSSNAFHVYTVWRATPTANATSAQPLPFCSIRPARKRFFAASLNRFCTMPIFSRSNPEDITHGQHNGCHVFREDQ